MRLNTLGGLELAVPPEDRPLRRPKPLLLLAYLAIEGPKERHHLAELFWPEAQRPLDSLRVALSQIRAAAPGVLIEVESPGVGARVGANVTCDALDLLEAVAAPNPQRARELYAGEFLAGFYLKEMGAELEEWLLATREHLATSLQLACVTEAESLASGLAFAEAGRIAADALGLAKETVPDLLPRLHRLLLAAAHPSLTLVERQASAYGIELTPSTEAARTALSSSGKQPALNNLPSRVSPFVGRDTELVSLANLLASGSRLVTVTGVGGVGKSRLALEAARTALRDGLFVDGVFIVELAPISDHRRVLGAIAAVVDQAAGTDVVAQLEKTIGDRNVLLLLDNFEHLTGAALMLGKLLEACPGLAALVTSRQPLDLSGEQLYHLSEFDLPQSASSTRRALTLDGVRLFQSAARRSQLSFVVDDENRDEVLEICRLVHGLPLGIELAAAWVGRLPLVALAKALREGPGELLTGPRDAAPRQRSLRATIEHSWNLLSDNETRALTRLAAFKGGFTRDAASRVAGASIVTLSSLGAKSLLNAATDGRYDAHPLVSDFARERLDQSGQERTAALEAHADYYGDMANAAEEGLKGGDQAGWLNRLDAELPNLHAAMAWLLAQAERGSVTASRAALDLSGSLWQYWLRRGRLAEGRRLADAALNLAPADDLALERAKALTGAGVLASRQGDEEASEAYNRAALELRRAAGDRLGEGRSLYNLAGIAGKAGDLALAEEYLTAAIDAFRELGDEWTLAYALFNLSTLARRKGRDDEAAAHLEERLRLQLALGDEAGTAETYDGLGHIYLDTDDLAAADESFEAALEIARRLQDFPEEASALEGLALVAHEKGSRAQSARLFDQASAIREEHDLGPSAAQQRLRTLLATLTHDRRSGGASSETPD